jgi:hypothetical protein
MMGAVVGGPIMADVTCPSCRHTFAAPPGAECSCPRCHAAVHPPGIQAGHPAEGPPATRACPHCGRWVPEMCLFCPYCERPVRAGASGSEPLGERLRRRDVGAGRVVLAVIGALFFYLGLAAGVKGVVSPSSGGFINPQGPATVLLILLGVLMLGALLYGLTSSDRAPPGRRAVAVLVRVFAAFGLIMVCGVGLVVFILAVCSVG